MVTGTFDFNFMAAVTKFEQTNNLLPDLNRHYQIIEAGKTDVSRIAKYKLLSPPIAPHHFYI